MDRFVTPLIQDRSTGPAPSAAGDGLAQGMVYTAVVQGTPVGGTVAVTIPALHLSASLVAHVPPGTVCVAGESCCVALDEQKTPWIVASKTLSAPTLVSALPASPLDGQEVYFQNATLATEGIVWHLRYRAESASGHKWEFIGGADWFFLGGDITTTSTVFVPLTGGPSFVVPVEGVYWLDVAAVFIPAAAGGFLLQPFQNSVETSAVAYFTITSAIEMVARGRPWTALLKAGETITLKVRTTNGASCRFVNCTLALRPIQVG